MMQQTMAAAAAAAAGGALEDGQLLCPPFPVDAAAQLQHAMAMGLPPPMPASSTPGMPGVCQSPNPHPRSQPNQLIGDEYKVPRFLIDS